MFLYLFSGGWKGSPGVKESYRAMSVEVLEALLQVVEIEALGLLECGLLSLDLFDLGDDAGQDFLLESLELVSSGVRDELEGAESAFAALLESVHFLVAGVRRTYRWARDCWASEL